MKTIKGEVIKMGTMHLNYEEVTGVFVECSEKDLKKLSTNLMYKKVIVQEQRDLEQRQEANQHDTVVSLSFDELQNDVLNHKAKSEYKQATIVILRHIFEERQG